MLEIKNLSVEFNGGGGELEVVRGLNLSMNDSEIVGIVGESGSGKTVTALAIAGLLSRQNTNISGEILLNGVDLLKCNRESLRQYQGRDIAMVFQEPMTSLNPLMKVGIQVEESLLIHTDMKNTRRKEAAISALESVEMPEAEAVYNMYPHQLSGGMRQRAMIAAALVMNPKLLIADEPTTALDVTIQVQILKLLKRINAEHGVGILFISHDLTVVSRLCQRVIVMKDGKMVEQGNTGEVFSSPKEEYTRRLIESRPSRRQRLR